MDSKEYVKAFGIPTSITKISKYGWKTKNQPGCFLEIDKQELVIPKEYQRSQKQKKVLEIASKWDWMACGALIVILRDDGVYYIIDGGHRKSAADKRADITTLPCLVFEGESVGKEAETFLDINNNRSAISSFEKFNAMREAGDKTVDECILLLKTTGHFFTQTATNRGVSCIRAILNSYTKNPSKTKQLWPLCVEIHGGETIHGEIWSGLFYLATIGDLDLYEYRKKLVFAGKTLCLQSINKSKVLLNAGGEKTCAHGLLSIINHKLRNKIIIKNL